MKEHIAKLIMMLIDTLPTDAPAACHYDLADQILKYQIEEIKKERSENPYSADGDTDSFFAFDLACVKLLKRFGQ